METSPGCVGGVRGEPSLGRPRLQVRRSHGGGEGGVTSSSTAAQPPLDSFFQGFNSGGGA